MEIARVTLYIEPANQASRTTAASAGFTHEDDLRAWETYDDGAPRDMCVYGRFAADLLP